MHIFTYFRLYDGSKSWTSVSKIILIITNFYGVQLFRRYIMCMQWAQTFSLLLCKVREVAGRLYVKNADQLLEA